MQNKIFIIIVTYQGILWLRKCLDSTLPYPVIIVDNNSSDNTVGYIEVNYPEVMLLKQTDNFGFGKANNIGIYHALKKGADYVFLLNQDAYLKKECIEELFQIHQNNKEYGIISPIHLNGSGNLMEKGFSKHITFKIKKNIVSDIKSETGLKRFYEVPFVNAAGWLISRECLLKVGGFDPIFFHYGEDVNYVQRVKYHGFKVGIGTKALMCHDREGSAIREGVRFSERYFINLERRCKMKWANLNTPLKIVEKEIKETLDKLKKEGKTSLLNLQIFQTRNIIREISLIKKCKKEILLSRERNLGEENIFSKI